MKSSRPYMIRALHEWIVDNEMTPHLMVDATRTGVDVPQQHVNEGKIVLNVAPKAVINLVMNNDWVTFDARFSGVVHRIRLPINAILSIYAMENGRGMFFDEDDNDSPPPDNTPPDHPSDANKGRPQLKIVK